MYKATKKAVLKPKTPVTVEVASKDVPPAVAEVTAEVPAQSESKAKQYFFTKEEKANIALRKALWQDHSYQASLIQADVDRYIRTTVFSRLGKDMNQEFTLSDDASFIEM